MLRGLSLAFLLLVPLATVPAAAPEPSADAPWWDVTLLDMDRDGLDDALVPLLSLGEPIVVLVAYPHVPTAADLDALRNAGHEVLASYDHFDVAAVRAHPDAVRDILRIPGVVFVEKNDVVTTLLRESVPLLGVPQVWQTFGATGRGVTVAVIDDGTFGQHPDLAGRLLGSYDASVPNAGGLTVPVSTPVVPASEEGHGTHVAGTIVGPGTESGGRYRGVAPNSGFVDVKVFSAPNRTSSDIVLRGLDWTLSRAGTFGIRVASMSLGGSPSDGRDALSRAVNVAVDKGLVVVAAAGNAGPDPQTIASPGAAEKAITVGAVDKQKRLASYSSRGPTLDGRVKPDVMAPGTAIHSTVPPVSTAGVRALLNRDTTLYYGDLTGTSMAAPHISGVAALMLEVNPDLAPIDVKRILIATAQDLGAAGVDTDTGYGFVNAIAAVRVADDPALLDSPQFASILGTLPEPEKEDFVTRATFEFERAVRQGRLILYSGIGLALAAVILAIVVFARRR